MEKKKRTNSRAKGARAERELAKVLNDYGYKTRRTVQYSGKGEETNADLIGLEGIHIECKWAERLNLYDAIGQARRDSKCDLPFSDKLPTVFHKKNHCEWLVTMPMEFWILLYKAYENNL